MSSLIEQQIVATFEAEKGQLRRVTSRSEVPPTYASITSEWLTDVLCAEGSGAKVTSFRLDEPDNGSSNRRRIFLNYNKEGQNAGLPERVFCKAAEDLDTRLVLGISLTAQAEANFFNKVRPTLNIDTPRAFYSGFDPANGAYLIMMEDIADQVSFCDERSRIDFKRASDIMDTMADLHAAHFASPDLGSPAIPFVNFAAWWERIMIGAPEFASSCDVAFGKCEDLMSPDIFRRRAEIWPLTDKAAERHRVLSQTLIHGDTHLKNWYAKPDGGMGVTDWQCVAIGHWSRDLTMILVTGLATEDRRAWESDLLMRYVSRMREAGVTSISFDEAMLNYRQQLLQLLSSWTITLCPAPGMPDMQPERTTIAFLKRIFAAMEDHQALDSFD